jgi:hypothetical protein
MFGCDVLFFLRCTKYVTTNNDIFDSTSLFPLLLLEQDLFCEDEELNTLFIKEKLNKKHTMSVWKM